MVYTLWALLNFTVSCPLLLYCNLLQILMKLSNKVDLLWSREEGHSCAEAKPCSHDVVECAILVSTSQ